MARRPMTGSDSAPTASRQKTTPVQTGRSVRRQDVRVLTSMPAGKMVPLAAFMLLREDRVLSSRLRVNFEMMETVELLMNAVNVRVMAYLVPFLAFDRFNGIDQLNRSYSKIPETDGGTVVPFFGTAMYDRTWEVFKYLGKHARQGQMVNTAYLEAYSEIWNFRAKNRSPDIPLRTSGIVPLAKAFWHHQKWAHVVPDFDQAAIDGEVPLNVVAGTLPIKGIGVLSNQTTPANTARTVYEASYLGAGVTVNYPANQSYSTDTIPIAIKTQAVGSLRPAIFAEMEENGITVSLSNIELARKTQAFAMLRKQYTGHSDEYIIDLLMNGISVPEQAWRQPILLADRSTIFGMSKRYASDSADLTASVVNGATFIDLHIVTPQVPTGGVVMIVAEIAPEQLFERSIDAGLHTIDTDQLPEFLRDTLDPEKVSVVQNQFVDVDHDTPTGTFGYAPLNFQWDMLPPGIGGKFFRPDVNAPFDEDRQRLWAVETENPTLAEDFYLCTNMHTKPFVVTDQDPFEAVMRGLVRIEGNTVFGRMLVEASDDYEQIMGEAPIDRIDKPAALAETKPAPEGEGEGSVD